MESGGFLSRSVEVCRGLSRSVEVCRGILSSSLSSSCRVSCRVVEARAQVFRSGSGTFTVLRAISPRGNSRTPFPFHAVFACAAGSPRARRPTTVACNMAAQYGFQFIGFLITTAPISGPKKKAPQALVAGAPADELSSGCTDGLAFRTLPPQPGTPRRPALRRLVLRCFVLRFLARAAFQIPRRRHLTNAGLSRRRIDGAKRRRPREAFSTTAAHPIVDRQSGVAREPAVLP